MEMKFILNARIIATQEKYLEGERNCRQTTRKRQHKIQM